MEFKIARYEPALPQQSVADKVWGVLLGNCVGDAIGLLTEFMSKKEAQAVYMHEDLDYQLKRADYHRSRFEEGDWTDDSDQMLLILQMLLDNDGEIQTTDFAAKMEHWMNHGMEEFGDTRGMGVGRTTRSVLTHKLFLEKPDVAAYDVWTDSGCKMAANGALMRTSVLGIMNYWNTMTVIMNTKQICQCTHYDPRCLASCVAVTTAISLMLQGMPTKTAKDMERLIYKCYTTAAEFLPSYDERPELKSFMYPKSLEDLALDEGSSIGYTYKCLGAGFWALRQSNFEDAITKLTYEAGDADTNCAVAGALLGCKLGKKGVTKRWRKGLKHKEWLDKKINCFLELINEKSKEIDGCSKDGCTTDIGGKLSQCEASGNEDSPCS